MRGQPEVRYTRTVDQSTLHHQPAHHALHRSKPEQQQRTAQQRRREIPSPRKEREWNEEGQTDRSREQPVQVFPEEDELELFERHAGTPRIVRKLLIEGERLPPLRVRERWNDAEQRIPIDDREPGQRETCNATHH